MRLRYFALFLSLISLNCFAQEAELITQQRDLGTITTFSFSKDGEYLASASEGENVLKVWHIASGKIIGVLEGHDASIRAITFGDNGNFLFSADKESNVLKWDLNSWQVSDSLKIEGSPTRIATNETHIVVGSSTKKVFISDYNFSSTTQIGGLKGAPNAFASSKGEWFVGSKLGELAMFTAESKSYAKSAKAFPGGIASLDLTTNNSKMFAVGTNGVIKSFDLVNYKMINEINPKGFGSRVLALDAKNGKIAWLKTKHEIGIMNLKGEELFSFAETSEEQDDIRLLKFSPDGGSLCSSGFRVNAIGKVKSNENSIKVWDIKRKNLLKELKGTVNGILQFSFHPVKNHVALLGENNVVSFWDLEHAEKMGQFTLEEPKIEQKQKILSEEDKRATTDTYLGGKVKIPNVGALGNKLKKNVTRRTVNKKFRKDKFIFKFSAKGNYLITKLKDDEVRIYQLKDGKVNYLHYAVHNQERVNDFITDPTEKYLICLGAGNDAVSIVNIETGELYRKLNTRNKDVQSEFLNNALSISYNPNGKNFAVCTGQGQVFVWNSSFSLKFKSSGSNLFRSSGNAFVNYSRDGKFIFVNSFMGVQGYDLENFGDFTPKSVELEGRPIALDNPQDYLISFQRDRGYIANVVDGNSVNFTINSRLITAVDGSQKGFLGLALKTGEFKLLDPTSGKEVITLVGEGNNTIFKTADNYYKIDKEGYDLVSFRVGKKAYPFDQFDAYFNRPDKVLSALKSEDSELISLYNNAHTKRLSKLGVTEDRVPNFNELPSVSIDNRSGISHTQEGQTLRLSIGASSNTSQLKELVIYINNVPVEKIPLEKTDVQITKEIELIAGINQIEVLVKDKNNHESLKESIEVECLRTDLPKLFLVAIGTSTYKNKNFNLEYAAKDANDMVELYKQNKTNFSEIITIKLTNEEVKKERFEELKEQLSVAGVNDQIVFFIAGHGVLNDDYDYFYGTSDIDFNNPEKRGLPYDKLEEILASVKPIKKLLIMDTCHSGEVDSDEVETVAINDEEEMGDIAFRSAGLAYREGDGSQASPGKMARLLFADIRKGSGTTVISSAGGVEFAMESAEWKNGLFTYCLLNGLKNKTADLNKDGAIMLSELQEYIIYKVGELSKGKQVPTSRAQNIRLDYAVW